MDQLGFIGCCCTRESEHVRHVLSHLPRSLRRRWGSGRITLGYGVVSCHIWGVGTNRMNVWALDCHVRGWALASECVDYLLLIVNLPSIKLSPKPLELTGQNHLDATVFFTLNALLHLRWQTNERLYHCLKQCDFPLFRLKAVLLSSISLLAVN